MELYVKVSFWIGVTGLALRLLVMMCVPHPRTTTHSAASDSAMALIGAAYAAWAGWLIFV